MDFSTLDFFYALFNIFLGISFILIGFERIKFKNPTPQNVRTLFKIGGIGLIIWGFIKLWISLN